MIDGPRLDSPEDLKARLSSLERRIREFRDGSMFRSEHAELLETMHRRRAAIDDKIDAAIARGDRWDMVRDEFARDWRGISDAFTDVIARAGEAPISSGPSGVKMVGPPPRSPRKKYAR
jgi:hypothetical protein